MAKLIDRLNKDHGKIRRLLVKVRRAKQDSGKLKVALKELKQPLLDHFVLEDEQLYAVLRQVAETDSRLRLLMNSFVDETVNVTKAVIDFFEKVASPTAEQVGLLVKMVETRMKREETIFFPEYERVVDFHRLPAAA